MKTRFRTFAALFAAGIVIASITGCASGSKTTSSIPPGTTATGDSVNIVNFAFSPSTLTVAVGTTVTWTNNDSAQHTVTSDTGVFNSGGMSQNAAFSYTFTTAGTFPYHCTVHPYMTAKVIVQ